MRNDEGSRPPPPPPPQPPQPPRPQPRLEKAAAAAVDCQMTSQDLAAGSAYELKRQGLRCVGDTAAG